MFVDEKGKYIFDIKKTVDEVLRYKIFIENKNDYEDNDIINTNIENNKLFTESEIQLINSLNTEYHIKIFSCQDIEQNTEYKNINWNLLITLTLKDSDTGKKLKHIERWLFHFSSK